MSITDGSKHLSLTKGEKTTRRQFIDIVLLIGLRDRCYNLAVPGAAPADGTADEVGAEERT